MGSRDSQNFTYSVPIGNHEAKFSSIPDSEEFQQRLYLRKELYFGKYGKSYEYKLETDRIL